MAVFDPKEKFQPVDLKYVSSYEIPALDMKTFADFSDRMFKAQEDKLKNIEKNFSSIMDTQDSLLGMRYDNARQAEVFQRARKKYTLTDDTFASLNVEDLQNSIYSRTLSGRFKQVSNDPEVVDVAKEVFNADDFRKRIPSIEDPVLRAMAMEQYRRYREVGDINGLDLNISDYVTVDLDKEMKEAVNLVKSQETADWETDPSGNFIGVRSTTEKDAAAVDEAIGAMLKKPRVVQNMKARGYMDKNGNLTPEYINHRDKLLKGMTEESSKLGDIRVLPDAQAQAKAKAAGMLGAGEEDYHGPGRFSNKTKDGRNANSIDRGLTSRGFEVLDEATTTAIANKGGGLIETVPPGNERNIPPGDYMVVKNNAGDVLIRIPLIKMSPDKFRKTRDSFIIPADGPADDIIRQIISYKESSGKYDIFIPSAVSGAVGKHQFIVSYHIPEIKQALGELGIDWTRIKPRANVNNTSGTMNLEQRQLAQAFMNSPEAQERAMDLWYYKLKQMLGELKSMQFSPTDAVQNLSDAEMMYILHHEGSAQAAMNYIRTGKSDHDKQNAMSTKEVTSSIRTIKNTLDVNGLTGNIKDDGTMIKTDLPPASNSPIGGAMPITISGDTSTTSSAPSKPSGAKSPNAFTDIPN